MSVDDMVGRDPRVRLLAKSLGWSVHQTVGVLICEVWPICYDQMTHLISERVIDAAADREGFAAALIDSELAHRDRSGKVYVAGAKKRIKYLEDKQRAGHEGGVKSAESRRKTPKQKSSTSGSTPQARRNPPVPDNPSAPVPDLVPPPVPDSDQEGGVFNFDEKHDDTAGQEPQWFGNPSPPASATTKKSRKRTNATQLPDGWSPGPYVIPNGVDAKRELERFRNHAQTNGRTAKDWQAAWRNWLLKAEEYARPSQQSRPVGRAEPQPASAYEADIGKAF